MEKEIKVDKKFNQKCLEALCCKKKTKEEDNVDMNTELIDNAPEKDELDTHDGVIWFPKELMPSQKSQDFSTPFIMKSKSLNLKLKFV
jgi:hypothetical protein